MHGIEYHESQHGDDFVVLPAREGYNRWAAIYDEEDNPLVLLEEAHVQRLLGEVANLDVADIGCGTGRHARPMALAGARVTALDFADEMVRRGREQPGWERIQFIAHDVAQPLPLRDQSFDRVLCCLVTEHIADLPALFGELRRICRPTGFIVLSMLHPAMMLRGVQARFTDPSTGQQTRPLSYPHQISDYVMAASRAGLSFDHISEHIADQELMARSERARKYAGWPLLLVMRLVLEDVSFGEMKP